MEAAEATKRDEQGVTLGPGVSAGSGTVRGVVLAGVHAWGGCVLEEAVCRPLLPVALKPLISYSLQWLRRGGIQAAHVCGNSDTVLIRRELGAGETCGIAIDYYEDTMPRGPAGCARDAAINTDADTVVVVEGTLVPSFDVQEVLAHHARTQAALTLVVSRRGKDGVCESAGVFVFARRVLGLIGASGYQDIKETLIPKLYRENERIETFVVPAGAAVRVTDAASYLGVNMWTVQQGGAMESPGAGYARLGEAWVHASAKVAASARLVGPVLVGPRCEIGEEALVVGPTTLGEACRIGRRAAISRSALWNGCEVGAQAVLDQCILADGAHVDAEVDARETAYVPRRRAARGLRRWLGVGGRTRAHGVSRNPAALPAI